MKTYLNRDGVYVAEKPKEYFVGKDRHGTNVFIGDYIKHRKFKMPYKMTEGGEYASSHYIEQAYKINPQ